MIDVVIRTLQHRPGRTATSVLAISVSIALVLFFEGFRAGLYQSVRTLPESLPATFVAMQAGVSNILGARSVLPRSARAEIQAIPGVRVAHPLGGAPIIYEKDGVRSPLYVLAYDTAGGPGTIVAGRAIAAPNEIVVDETLARRYALRPDDTLEFFGHRFQIAGLSSRTATMFGAYVYVPFDDMVDLYLAGDLPEDLASSALSFLLVEVDPLAELREVRAAIEARVPSVDVFTPAELGDNDVRRARRFMDPPLSVLIAVAWIVALLVVALTLYASVVARLQDFGVMKALGTRDRTLGALVMAETVAVTIPALLLAFVWAFGLQAMFEATLREYPVAPFRADILVRTVLATIVLACGGAVAPVARAARIDPATVFARQSC
jgi:ABC-type antimicrobial peptide transport system permease subunit